MQLPIVAPAPVVTAHADIFRDLFENRCQFRHFQNYLVATSFFPKLIRTCDVERLIVSCGSRLPLHQESLQCALFAIFSIG